MSRLDALDTSIQPRTADCPVPLTAWQRRISVELARQEEPLSVRACAASLRILGPLDARCLQSCIEAVVRRHESLRTRVVTVDGIPRQHIDTASDVHPGLVDLTGLPAGDRETAAAHAARDVMREKVDLSVGPLFRAELIKLSNHEHVLVLALDHIVSDATSYAVLSEDMWTLYVQAAQGEPPSLPPLSLQFADYAVWQHKMHDVLQRKHAGYWRQRLTGAPRLRLPFDVGSTSVSHPVTALMHFPFGKNLSSQLRDLARREGALLPLLMLSVYVAMLSRWCKQRDLVLAVVSQGRHRHRELRTMIGLLAKLLHMRIEVSRQDSFIDLLRRVSSEFRTAYEHQDYDRLPDLVPECVAEACFNWISTKPTSRSIFHMRKTDEQLETVPFPIPELSARVDDSWKLGTVFADTPAGIVMTVWYRCDLFLAGTIEGFGRNLCLFAKELTERPSELLTT